MTIKKNPLVFPDFNSYVNSLNFLFQEKILVLENLSDVTLSCASKILDDDVVVGSLECDTLDLNAPLLGGKQLQIYFFFQITQINKVNELQIFKQFFFYFLGKVHGSLARAGKVKGATPKVIFIINKNKTKNKMQLNFDIKILKKHLDLSSSLIFNSNCSKHLMQK